MGVGLIVGVWIARYLGPEKFGQLSFAIAFVGVLGVIAVLGLNDIVVRDIVREPDCADITLGTAFILRIFGGLLSVGLIIGTVIWLRPHDEMTRLMVAVLSLSLVFNSTEVVRYWFESQVQSRYAVWAENASFLVVAIIKVVLILNRAPLIAFVWAILIEAILVAIGLLTIYVQRGTRLRDWRPRIARAKTLLQDSWPLLLSGVAVMVYMRIDQIMLGEMIGHEAVGIYTAAVRISELWYFIPMIIVSSVFPSIIEAKKLSETVYMQRLQGLYDLMVLVALVVVIPMTFLSDWIIESLFGASYAEAGAVLAIHIWAGIFVGLGVASGKWYLIEEMSSYLFCRAIIGALINVGLNLLLIHEYGVKGAAMATLLSYFVAGFFFDLFMPRTRVSFIMKVNSLLLRGFYVGQTNH